MAMVAARAEPEQRMLRISEFRQAVFGTLILVLIMFEPAREELKSIKWDIIEFRTIKEYLELKNDHIFLLKWTKS